MAMEKTSLWLTFFFHLIASTIVNNVTRSLLIVIYTSSLPIINHLYAHISSNLARSSSLNQVNSSLSKNPSSVWDTIKCQFYIPGIWTWRVGHEMRINTCFCSHVVSKSLPSQWESWWQISNILCWNMEWFYMMEKYLQFLLVRHNMLRFALTQPKSEVYSQ